MSKSIEYRPEIDALRALAVLPVIFFHGDVPGFQGGFIGVDVFFVISGYLITKLLVNDLNANTFSFIEFYERRARRLLPALFTVLLATTLVAWTWLMPSQLVDFGQSLVAVSIFSSNVLFWSESGYFSASAEEKPLLHTWSLGVEEQFYIFFPLLLVWLYRLSKKGGTPLVLCLICTSFIFSLLIFELYPSANFYLLFSRAWELLLGSLVALRLDNIRARQFSQTLSLSLDALTLVSILILVYFVVAWNGASYAGPLDLILPVVSTACIIAFVRTGTLVHKMLCIKWLVRIGLISYSLYLWHQPFLAYARISSEEALTFGKASLAISLSFFMAYLSWRYVERPFRDRNVFSTMKIYFLSVFGLIFFAIVGLLFHLNDGFPGRVVLQGSPKDKSIAAAIFNEWDFSGYPAPSSLVRADGNAQASLGTGMKYLLVGDSHALQYWYGLVDFANNSQGTETPHTVSLNPASFPPKYDELHISEDTRYVLFSYFWSLKFGDETVDNEIRCCGDGPGGTIGKPIEILTESQRHEILVGFEKLFAQLIAQGITPVIVLDNPFGEELNPKSLLNIARTNKLSVSLNNSYSLKVSRELLNDRRIKTTRLLKNLPNSAQIIFIDPYDQLCGLKSCEVINAAGNFVYKDYDHLAHSVAVDLAPYIFGSLSEGRKKLEVY